MKRLHPCAQDLKRILDGTNTSEKNEVLSDVFDVVGGFGAGIHKKQAELGSPRAIEKQLNKAKKVPDNEEQVQRLTDQHQEAKMSKGLITEGKKMLKNIKNLQKQLSSTIKKG